MTAMLLVFFKGLDSFFFFFLSRYLPFIASNLPFCLNLKHVRVSIIVEFVEMKLVSISIFTQNQFILSTIMTYR